MKSAITQQRRQGSQKLAVYEQADVREVSLAHPTDPLFSVYTLSADGSYGKPAIHETKGN